MLSLDEALKNVTIIVRQARLNANEHEALRESMQVITQYAQKGAITEEEGKKDA